MGDIAAVEEIAGSAPVVPGLDGKVEKGKTDQMIWNENGILIVATKYPDGITLIGRDMNLGSRATLYFGLDQSIIKTGDAALLEMLYGKAVSVPEYVKIAESAINNTAGLF